MAHALSANAIPAAAISGERLAPRSRVLTIAGIVLLVAGFAMVRTDPGFAAKAWLQAWLFAVSLSLGALFFVIIQHLTRAGWSVVVRRVAECIAANLLWLWLGFLPIAWLWFDGRLDTLFPWANLDHLREVAPEEAALVGKKVAFLNPGFFMIRAASYLLVWALLARFFLSNSVAQDSDRSVARSEKMGKWAGPAAILFGLTTTFASFDWIMSLNPAWFSTMFGVYFFAACCAGGFSAIALMSLRAQSRGLLKDVVTPEHYQDLGKMLFGFGIVFWAYIAFSQYMLIWYGNVPEETTWFMARQIGQWRIVSAALLFGHFVIPFLFLISRWTKRWRGTLTFGVAWMLVFHWVDLAYLIQPVIPHDIGKYDTYDALLAAYANEAAPVLNPGLIALSAGMLFLLVGRTLARLVRTGLLCKGDPRLAESLRFENF
ncbi:MAG: quinol:cytochrome C oxidoreductase [Planctomycetes bacterium]|nr:quinol:cytochrome C oxidoreductase [Planctomycetota bacterium]